MITKGTPVVVRAYGSGVHYGELLNRSDHKPGVLTLANHRRVWRWNVDDQKLNTVSELANVGPNTSSRLSISVPSITIIDCIEMHALTGTSLNRFQNQGWEDQAVKLHGFTRVPDNVQGEYCLIRTYGAGVFAGVVEEWGDDRCPEVVVMSEARRVFAWSSDTPEQLRLTLNEIAVWGITPNSGSRIAEHIQGESELFSVTEILPVSREAERSIRDFHIP